MFAGIVPKPLAIRKWCKAGPLPRYVAVDDRTRIVDPGSRETTVLDCCVSALPAFAAGGPLTPFHFVTEC